MAPVTDPAPRPLWRLALLLYPFASAAVAINLFLLGLLGLSLGLPTFSPWQAVLWALPLGLPATWAAARWVRALITRAEG
ncbi:hypothetical protein [Rhodobacter ferrooxidans]|uniref:NnrT protein n=1 Tax=Rhodobacter ferrooxidans TaxID=371731 RepID=C8RWJ3_9RHOB|nr:hypothetical protein [Rhodobacter sp. SW2]EEW26936.1 conserved hypothetical protein [Rhodobacter sp. SW2]